MPIFLAVQDVCSGPLNFYLELWFIGDMTETELHLFRILSKKLQFFHQSKYDGRDCLILRENEGSYDKNE